jgi:hypothetical protein
VPESHDENLSNEKIVAEFSRVLTYLDNSDIKLMCNNIARKAIVEGVYYGYVVEGPKRLFVQDLPAKYCRSRYSVAGRPAVEFNMRFFDESFPDAEYRVKVLKLFPKDFQEGYFKYKAGKL